MYINDFQILDKVYEDIIGELYFANSATLRKDVHFKFLHEYFLDKEDIVTTFHKCSKRARILEDEIFVNVLSDGEQGDKHFIIMEADDLIPLDAILTKRVLLPPLESVSFIEALAGMLRKAHIEGLIHGNLTPENIFVNQNLSKIKIAGFEFHDLVRLLILRKHSTLLKVLPYFAPETITDTKQSELDRKSDIYSLGVLFYRVLVGEPPWQAQRFEELEKSSTSRTIIPPSLQRLEVPDFLDQLIMESLEHDCERRCPNISAFLNKLNKAKAALLTTRTPTSAILYEHQLVQDNRKGDSSAPGDASSQEEDDADEMFRELNTATQALEESLQSHKEKSGSTEEKNSQPAKSDLNFEEDASREKENEIKNYPFLEADEFENISPESESEFTDEEFKIEKSHEEADKDHFSEDSENDLVSNEVKIETPDTEQNAEEELKDKTIELQIPNKEVNEEPFFQEDEDDAPSKEMTSHVSRSDESQAEDETEVDHEHTELGLRIGFDNQEDKPKPDLTPNNKTNFQQNISPNSVGNANLETTPRKSPEIKPKPEKKRYPTPDYAIKRIAIAEDDDVMDETGTQTQNFATTHTVNLTRVKPKGEDLLGKIRLVLIALIPIMSIYLIVGIAFDSKSSNRASKFVQETFFGQNTPTHTEMKQTFDSKEQSASSVPVENRSTNEVEEIQISSRSEDDNELETQINSILNQRSQKEPLPVVNETPSQTSTILPTEVRLQLRVRSGQSPVAADVFIDGDFRGTTNSRGQLTISNLQNRRSYVIKVQKQGFEIWAQEVRFIRPGLETIDVSLKRSSTNSTSPANDLSANLPNEGRQNSKSTKQPIQAATKVTKPQANLRSDMVQSGTGTINVELSNPESLSDVYIHINGEIWDGEDNLAPAQIDLPGGNYIVEVKKAGYRSAPQFYSVNLLNGDQKTLTFILLPD